MKEFPDLIAQRALMSGDAIAMRDHLSGASVTYGELNQRASMAANLFAIHEVAEGDRVAILCRNRIEFFECLFAAAKRGAILVPLNWRMPAPELTTIIERCAPKLILFGSEDADTLAESRANAPSIGLDDDTTSGYEHAINDAPASPRRAFWSAGDPWYLLFTSGTTGRPKAVIQTAQMALMNYINAQQAVEMRSGERTLNFLPLFHTAGINLFTLPFLFAGGEVTVLPGFDENNILPLLMEGAVDSFFGVPACYQKISLHRAFETADLSKVRHWGCGGAPLPDVLVEAFAGRGAKVCNGFGMTETGPTAFLMDRDNVSRKIGSVGRTQLMTAARIVERKTNGSNGSSSGELQLRGPAISPGYWDGAEATASAFTDDGWLKTGDLARTDAEGYTYITGRLKEMYISGGENVYPAEIENVLTRHPAVLEAAVVGVPDSQWGEVGRAYVMLRSKNGADAASLQAFGRENLAAYKVPKSYIFVDEFPRTAAGKVQKHILVQEHPAS